MAGVYIYYSQRYEGILFLLLCTASRKHIRQHAKISPFFDVQLKTAGRQTFFLGKAMYTKKQPLLRHILIKFRRLIRMMLILVGMYRMKILNVMTKKKLLMLNHRILILMLLQFQKDLEIS